MPSYHHLLIAAALMLSANISTAADTYRWTDEDGNTVFSDRNTDTHAQTAKPSHSVNYYSAPEQKTEKSSDSDTTHTLATLEALPDDQQQGDDSQPLTEAQCQEQYLLSCDEVVNWEKYAREACQNDARCEDPDYLERKYRPRTVEELNEIARRAGVRKNNFEQKIKLFLKKKYTSFCADRAEQVCLRSELENCESRVEKQCQGTTSLKQMLARYDGLSMVEKRKIIEQAKQMAIANGDSSYNYEAMIGNLIEILITQAMLGV